MGSCQQQRSRYAGPWSRHFWPLKTENRITRRALARLLDVHQDTLSRQLADGLGIAVVTWGGRGSELIFDQRLALRYWNASSCPRGGAGGRCPICGVVLEDCVAVAEHLIEARHGYGGCELCRVDHAVIAPCRGVDVAYR
jgi:hypothetical protein